MKSRIYKGQVRHRRFSPRPHSFKYSMFMMYLDLDELPTLFDRFWLWSSKRPNIAWFSRKDHLGDNNTTLADSARELIFQHTGIKATGPIRLLTHLKYFGFGFNPVSFYYCYDKDDTHVEVIIAEVNNTPWGEQYCYVLAGDQAANNSSHLTFSPVKEFHVSPFIPMDIQYDWRFSAPGDRLSVHMVNLENNSKLFDATLDLHSQEINTANLASALIRFPFMTMKVVAGIYFEALRLMIKRTPFFDHPGNNNDTIETRNI